MKKKIAYGVFTKTDSGKDYMVKGNFGDNVTAANSWAINNAVKIVDSRAIVNPDYPNGLEVKKIKY